MLDGTYKVTIDVLFGRKVGTAVLRTQGDTVSIDVNAPFVGRQRVDGKAQGDSFIAQGTGMVMLLGKVNYTMKGQVDGDNLHLSIESNKGGIVLEGVRV